ncbi:MAG: hypothetical protein ACI8RZ_002085 [Myxococcota bacterium]|jgi:hypothetical protein
MALSVLVRAAVSAALTPSVPSWPTVQIAVARWDRSHVSRDPAALQDRMLTLIAGHTPTDPWRLPWAPDAALSLTDLSAALIGRCDDYAGPMPEAMLPAVGARALMDDLSAAAAQAGRPLDVCEQFAVALAATDGHPFAAALLLHLTIRVLARGADRRRDPALALWLDERLALGAAVAAFEDAAGDPLGDARHYWAMVCAGMGSVWAKQTGRRSAGRLHHATFYLAPQLADRVRMRLEGPHSERGRIRRMGLRHGITLGVAAVRQARVTGPRLQHEEAARPPINLSGALRSG